MSYKNFKKVWNEQVLPIKQQMLDYENDNTGDVVFIDIVLDETKIKSSADTQNPEFWFSMTADLIGNAYDDNDKPFPMPTKYYIKMTPAKISLQHETMEMSFSELWNIDTKIEQNLITAILEDMIELYPECLMENMTPTIIDNLFENDYINIEQFDTDTLLKYYDKFDNDNFLSEDVQDLFLF